jgi:transcriptional regulator with XRE-family HTH domain
MKEETARPMFRYRLRAAFLEQGYKSVSDIADAVGVKRNTLDCIFSGWRYPSPEMQGRLAKALRLSKNPQGRFSDGVRRKEASQFGPQSTISGLGTPR